MFPVQVDHNRLAAFYVTVGAGQHHCGTLFLGVNDVISRDGIHRQRWRQGVYHNLFGTICTVQCIIDGTGRDLVSAVTQFGQFVYRDNNAPDAGIADFGGVRLIIEPHLHRLPEQAAAGRTTYGEWQPLLQTIDDVIRCYCINDQARQA
ncbi:hypothetical protein D3C80_1580740 [compost metagenome]